MKLPEPGSCRREPGKGNFKPSATLVESPADGFSDGGSTPPASTTQMSSPRQKEICLGLDIFYVRLPVRSITDKKTIRASRVNAAESRNLPLNLDAVIGKDQHPVDQEISKLLSQLI